MKPSLNEGYKKTKGYSIEYLKDEAQDTERYLFRAKGCLERMKEYAEIGEDLYTAGLCSNMKQSIDIIRKTLEERYDTK